jgi:hypothetical protein
MGLCARHAWDDTALLPTHLMPLSSGPVLPGLGGGVAEGVGLEGDYHDAGATWCSGVPTPTPTTSVGNSREGQEETLNAAALAATPCPPKAWHNAAKLIWGGRTPASPSVCGGGA